MKALIKIAENYGFECQLTKLAEECSEFSSALHKFSGYSVLVTKKPKRSKYFQKKRDESEINMFQELADVFVLVRQIKYFLKTRPAEKTMIKKFMREKIERQILRIEEENDDSK